MKYGRINAEDDVARDVARVTVDGRNVTQRCTMADDVEGVVELLAVDDGGRYILDGEGDLVRETIRGRVAITMRDVENALRRDMCGPPLGPARGSSEARECVAGARVRALWGVATASRDAVPGPRRNVDGPEHGPKGLTR